MRFHILKFDLSLLAARRDLIGLRQLNELHCWSFRVLYSISINILQGRFFRSDLYERQHSSFLTTNHPEIPRRVSSPIQNRYHKHKTITQQASSAFRYLELPVALLLLLWPSAELHV
jgi:hypothetical protein